MVGIPRSKGCALCRRRKVKCDEKTPACTQCTRGRHICPGYDKGLKIIDQGPALAQHYGANTSHNLSRQHTTKRRSPASKSPSPPTVPSTRIVPTQHIQSIDQTNILSSYQANKEQLLSLYINSIFPNATSSSIDSSLHFTRNWIAQIPRFFGKNAALDFAAQSLITSYFGRVTSNVAFQNAGKQFYGRALHSLSKAIQNPVSGLSTETLCATMLLNSYEIINCTRANSWIAHAGGAGRLMQMRGPDRHRSGFDHAIMMSFRQFLVVEALATSKPCFLSKPEWKEVATACDDVPAQHRQLFELANEQLLILSEIADLIHWAQNNKDEEDGELYTGQMRREEDSLSFRLGQMYRERIKGLQDSSRQWRIQFLEHVGEPEIVRATRPTEMVPLSYRWPHIFASSPGCTFHVTQLLLHEISGRQDPEDMAKHVHEICMNADYAETMGLIGAQYIAFGLTVAWGCATDEARVWIRNRMDEIGKMVQVAAWPISSYPPPVESPVAEMEQSPVGEPPSPISPLSAS